jgi:hypothetical protein
LCEELAKHDHRTVSDQQLRVVVAEKWTGSNNFTSGLTFMPPFKTSDGLMRHLNSQESTPDTVCSERLFVLEDIAKPYIQALAEHLDYYLDATVLASHLRMRDSTHFSKSNAPTIESLNSRGSSFSIQYQELRLGLPRTSSEGSSQGGALFCNANVYREILVADTTSSGVNTNLAIVPRKATFWNHSKGGSEWTGVLLLDPPLGDAVLRGRSKNPGGSEQIKLTVEELFPNNALYQGGYIDIEGWPKWPDPCDRESVSSGPARKSELDDFIFHWTRRQEHQEDHSHNHEHDGVQRSSTRDMVREIVEKIAISNWIVLIEYLRHKFFQLERSTQEGLNLEDLKARKEVHRWRRSCALFIEQVQSSMASIKGTLAKDQSLNSGWDYILTNLEALRDRMDNVAETSVALLGILESRKSLQEATDVGRLTRLGMIFLPLSFTAAIFSMGSDYAPGSTKFWVYFAIGIPLTLFILFLAFMDYLGDKVKPLSNNVSWRKMASLSLTRVWRKVHGVETLYDLEDTLHPGASESRRKGRNTSFTS